MTQDTKEILAMAIVAVVTIVICVVIARYPKRGTAIDLPLTGWLPKLRVGALTATKIATGAITTWHRWNDDDELAMPCQHPVRDLMITTDQGDVPAIAVRSPCRACRANLLGDLRMTLESDGRLFIENETDRTITLAVDGEIHHLFPRVADVKSSHVVRFDVDIPGYNLKGKVRVVDDPGKN